MVESSGSSLDRQSGRVAEYLDFVSLYTAVHKDRAEARKEANLAWKDLTEESSSPLDYLEEMALLRIQKRHQALGIECCSPAKMRCTCQGEESDDDDEDEDDETTGADFMIAGAEHAAQVAGDWDGWKPRWLKFDGEIWETKVDLKPGTYRYKFVIDGEWIYDPSKETEEDENGNINNVMVVEDKSKVGMKLKEINEEITRCRMIQNQPWKCEIPEYTFCPK